MLDSACELFGETICNVFGCCFVAECYGCVFRVAGDALLDRPCMVFQKYVCCACEPNEHLDAPSICCLCFCMSEVISSFRSLSAGSQVFALLMLFVCVILHTMS